MSTISAGRLSRPSPRMALIAGFATVACGLVASAGLIWHASYSSFSATTTNPTNNWTTGTVVLADDDSNSALFTVSNMKPGATGSRCIVVTSTGSLPSSVTMYTTPSSFAQTNAVADNETLTVTQGTNNATTSAGSCANFVADSGPISTTGSMTAFSTARTGFGNGFGSWTTTGSTSGESKVYKIDYTFGAGSSNTQQGGSASIGFTWEAQNT